MLTITTNSFENDVLYADTLIAGKINYDEEPQLIERFSIDTIPTLMLFKSG